MGGRCDLTQCSSDDVTVAWCNQDVWMEVIACSDFEKTTRWQWKFFTFGRNGPFALWTTPNVVGQKVA